MPEKSWMLFCRATFIGCADGPEDLANQYKDYLTRDLNAKHGAR